MISVPLKMSVRIRLCRKLDETDSRACIGWCQDHPNRKQI
jgi:hypothetical protein